MNRNRSADLIPSRWEGAVKDIDPDAMTVDELWEIHERISQVLCSKIQSEQRKLDGHLSRLRLGVTSGANQQSDDESGPKPARRPYPKVYPKYRSLKDPSLTWAGRGKQPLWLIDELKSGKSIDDFLIRAKPSNVRKKRR
ncbi:Histone-like nucleoid-structuring protein H-NS [Rhodopseudomonas palustris BisB5]|uniref:Histone-like nucleoid-structuring protein H-NS n=1 Tax=Rhodopseudomonas palustris (strain BisB5) TaxID=316057 RepID=Q136M2_RHOPS|nr:Histone-like nucleoid-structuring protein H-NS [Rhodopseudomonas palustris BisB5]